MKPKRSSIRRKSEINITPLIDVLLVLLVIFMVITPVTPSGLDAAIPRQTAAPHPESREATIVISLDRSGNIRINREAVERPEFRSRLEEIFRSRSDRTIYLSADSELLFNDVALVLDAAKSAGASRIGLMTEAIE